MIKWGVKLLKFNCVIQTAAINHHRFNASVAEGFNGTGAGAKINALKAPRPDCDKTASCKPRVVESSNQ